MATSSSLSALRKSFDWSKINKAVFSGWEVKEKILRPVTVNLLTALLIFLAAVIFKDNIYDYFFYSQSKDWPIYCVLEPEVSTGGPVTADLFVINLTNIKYAGSELDKLANDQSPKRGKGLSPLIDIALKDNLQDQVISDVQPDRDFNKEKGSAGVIRVDQGHWQIRLDEIKEGKMLKFIIHTTEERPISSRASFETLPIKLVYARSQ